VEYAWDERKNRVNKRKHRISFETAISVFDDPFHVSRQDREVGTEARWQTIGLVQGSRVLLVAHTIEEERQLDPSSLGTKGNTTGEAHLCAGLLKR
jgi:uncharacterized protein